MPGKFIGPGMLVLLLGLLPSIEGLVALTALVAQPALAQPPAGRPSREQVKQMRAKYKARMEAENSAAADSFVWSISNSSSLMRSR